MPTTFNEPLKMPALIPGKPPNVISFVRNIFALNPSFLRFCLNRVISSHSNSFPPKNLGQKHQKKSGDITMPVHPSVKECTHIKVTGIRCGSPALRGEQFCYFHQRMIRGVKTPPSSRLHPMALIEDEESIQASLMEVINALVRNHIDAKRAELILRALNTAVRNARRVRFQAESAAMVREVPNYPAPPQSPKPGPGKTVVPVSNRPSGYIDITELEEVKEIKEVQEVEAKQAKEEIAEVTEPAGAPSLSPSTAPSPDPAESKATKGAPFLARPVREKACPEPVEGWVSTEEGSTLADTTHHKPPSRINKLPAVSRKTQSARRE